MKELLKITVFQTNIIWNNKVKNLEKYDKKLMSVDDADLVLFPELFDIGFVTDTGILDKNKNEYTKNWLIKNSEKYSFAIGGTTIYKEKNKYFNRFYIAQPNGKIDFYDKKHLFAIAGEVNISKGDFRKIINLKGWRINMLICYDLRFPVWARNKKDYDILIYPANWPLSRINQWKILLKARAIENQAYCIGINRIGKDENGFEYPGNSMIINPKGDVIFEAKNNSEDSFTATFDYNYLKKLRKNFPVLNDADNFQIID